MNLNDIKATGSRHRPRTRRGRGRGSGKGKTCGRGSKGQKARSGGGPGLLYEGGQMPLFRRLPKRGFNNARFRAELAVVNVGQLNRFEDGQEVNPGALVAAGLVRSRSDGVKVLGDGELRKRLTVKAHRFSRTAAEKIAQAGGTVVPLS